ncbi:MAG: GTP-binding protein [Acidobacteriia bacterium]|nr:GTP-binding protein [Methyloceanibacter sp.]MCL6493041.1 GTP-binding protein [Terriglobia bacterium]
MRLKLFRAASMAEAMASVRRELGPDALILSSRRVHGGVEIAAALEPSPAEPDEPLRPFAPLQTVSESERARREAFAFHGLPSALADALAQGELAAGLSALFAFAPLPLHPGSPPLLFVGPPGAGKTLTVARLATRLVLGGTRPLVITADSNRAGAGEQLAAFTRLLGLTLLAASRPVSLGLALARREDGAPVLIDAPGIDPSEPEQCETLAVLAAQASANVILVLPAGLDAGESADLAMGFASLGASFLLATRLDMARRLGGIFAAARAAKLALTEGSAGPGAADRHVSLTPEFLSERLLQTTPYRPSSFGDARP